MWRNSLMLAFFAVFLGNSVCRGQSDETRDLFQVPVIQSSWDDLIEGIKTKEDWRQRREILKKRYLDLIRDEHKPEKPPLELKVHETVVVDETYTRKLISYSVELFKHIRPGLLEHKLPPIDFHEIIALIAPRAFLDLSGLNDGNPGTQRQRVLMLTRIMDIYELEKAPQNFAFYVHGRAHSVAHESRQLIYGWMDT